MQVFKFGGASVKDAAAIKNLAEIVARYKEDKLLIVVSAMGKTTNGLY
jgi:aspartate kinase